MSLFILILLNISRLHQMIPIIGVLRPGLLLTGIAMASAILLPQHVAKGWTRLWTTRVVAGIALIVMASIPFGISPGGSFYAFSQNYYKVLVVAFLLMAAIRDARDIWLFSWAFVLGCAVLVYQAVFMFTLSPDAGTARLSGMFMWDANDMGLILLMGMPLCMLLWRGASTPTRVLLSFILVGMGAALARSGSRGAFVGLACLVLAYLVFLKGVSLGRKVAVVAVLAIGLGIAAPEGYWDRMGTLTELEEDYNVSAPQGRKQLTLRGMQYMLSRPLFGLGIGNFGRAEGTISDLAREWRPGLDAPRWSAPHNTYVQAGAELGIPGLLLFSGLVIGCIVGTRRLRRVVPRHWSKGTWEQRFLDGAVRYVPLTAIGFAVPATFLSFVYLDPVYFLAALTGGVYAAIPRARARAAARTGSGRHRVRRAPFRRPTTPRSPSGEPSPTA